MATPNTLPDGLHLYLQIRNWAFERMKTVPRGSPLLDMEIYHYLYLSNALAAIDLVGETFYGKGFRNPAYETDYERSLIAAFDSALMSTPKNPGKSGKEAYAYVRELRNSVVHRGLDSATAGHANADHVFALCPATVHDLAGKNTYSCPCKYMVELGELSNLAFNPVIYEELDKRRVFDSNPPPVNEQDAIDFLNSSNAMPDWAKAMAREAFTKIDFPRVAAEVATTRMRELKALLGRS
jgi:hypothetical protein